MARSAIPGPSKDKTGPATDQPLDLSMTFRTFGDWLLGDRLAALEPQAASSALILVGHHGSNPFGILQIHFPFIGSDGLVRAMTVSPARTLSPCSARTSTSAAGR